MDSLSCLAYGADYSLHFLEWNGNLTDGLHLNKIEQNSLIPVVYRC